jgi:osmotically-inducible protein OsmY
VSTTDGVVTLSGKVDSAQLVSRAMLLALETGGVRQVISTLQIDKP